MNSTSFPKVFVIVLNYNAQETLRDCLLSIFQQDYSNFEVILVDNFSTDGSFEMAKDNFSRCYFIRNSENIGFAKGNNLGIRFALEKMADYVLLLNPDAIIEKDALSKLVVAAEGDLTAGILSPIIFQGRSNLVWFSGGKIDWLKMKTLHFQTLPLTQEKYSTDYLSGCTMLIRKEVFQKIGLFDEDFFLYYEDADLSLRTRKKNFSLIVVPEAKVYHFEKSENDPIKKTYWLVLSGLLFFHKNRFLGIKTWMTFYVKMRRIKNWIDLRKGKAPLAETIKNAYNDYDQWNKKQSNYPLL